MEFFILIILLNVVSVFAIFGWIWFVAGKNKTAFAEKFDILGKKIDNRTEDVVADINHCFESYSKAIKENVDAVKGDLNNFRDNYVNDFKSTKEITETTKEFAKKVSEQHEEYHSSQALEYHHHLRGEVLLGVVARPRRPVCRPNAKDLRERDNSHMLACMRSP